MILIQCDRRVWGREPSDSRTIRLEGSTSRSLASGLSRPRGSWNAIRRPAWARRRTS